MNYKVTDEDSGEIFKTNSLKEVEHLIYGKEKFPTFALVLITILSIVILILLLVLV